MFIHFIGRIALAIPVYELAMSVCLSVNILVKFLVQAKSQLWLQIHVSNTPSCKHVSVAMYL